MADTRKSRHVREQKRRASHLCVRCGKNETGGPKHCKICLASANRRTREMWQRRKDAGLCWNCGERSPAPKRAWCIACRSKKMRDKRKLVAMGMCNVCLARKPMKGYKSCERCRNAQERFRDRLRDETFSAYGGAICNCCGEKEIMFLDIDHISGRSSSDPSPRGGATLKNWLKRNEKP